ncbi:hypothetical protein GLOIN_2v1879967 [Rhizophagus irregularis DAOM 181602=DAOM 197198]|nr:hypothetical protein GLOIN_2v1879967 [Rhizophagus irregularis DAOM 181602=DAOM 197198]
MESRAKQIKIPADLERIPSKISTGEGFSGFIADQWRSFILIYATPLMWDLLNDPDQKILANFVAQLIENIYRPEMITPNIHLSLYISECFEGLKLVKSWLTTGSLLAYDNFEWDELYRFRLIYSLEVEDTITGSEQFPREIMTPRKQDVILPNNIYKLLVDYYNNVYNLKFVTIADSIESRLQSRHPIVNSFILAKFVQDNNVADVFSGQVQYYLEHEVNLPSSKQTHKLAFVKWYLPAPNYQKRFYCQIENDINICNIELWKNRFYEIGRDSIIPIHHIYSRFIPSKFILWNSNRCNCFQFSFQQKFKDEVVQILSGLDNTLQLDHTKKWIDIARHVAKNIMKEIDKAMKGRFQYKDTELKWVLQQLHRHHHENWRINLDPEKAKFVNYFVYLIALAISHVKVFHRRWYEDKKWCDNFKPPEDAPEWTISRSYNNNDDHQSMIGSGEKENIENE